VSRVYMCHVCICVALIYVSRVYMCRVNICVTCVYVSRVYMCRVCVAGIMMCLAWMLCCSVGIVIARYQKDMLPDKKLFGTKYWFQLHRGAMIGVIVFGVIGFIPIFVELEGYSQVHWDLKTYKEYNYAYMFMLIKKI